MRELEIISEALNVDIVNAEKNNELNNNFFVVKYIILKIEVF